MRSNCLVPRQVLALPGLIHSASSRTRRYWALGAATALLCFGTQAYAVSCATESQMTNAQRAEYVRALRALEAPIQAGNADAVKAMTVASVAASFEGIAQSIQSLSPQIQGAAFTIGSMYQLNASDLKTPQEETQFFCSVPGSSLVVTATIPQLPPGIYLLALLHATGVQHPQQVALILQKDGDDWKLAGFFVRPMSLGGREGVWYWAQARQYAQKRQDWNSYFYYETAAFLLTPVDFLMSPNLEKLQKEAQTVRPPELPGTEPMKLAGNGQTFEITSVRTDGFAGELDLVVNYRAKDVSDPVAARTEILALMKALLAGHPELRQAFHGLWVYANAPNQRPYAIELPMGDIH